MALQITTNINVDFCDKKHILINAKQLDRSSRFLSIACYNHGKLFPLSDNQHSVYVRYKKPDNYSVFNLCEITYKGNVLVELTEQMLVSDGICCVDLVIVNKGDAKINTNTGEITAIENASILSSMVFYIDVSESAVLNSEIESSYEYSGLNDALQKAEAEYQEVIQLAKSYAVGDAGGIRNNEDVDNAKYYYQQSLISSNNSDAFASNAALSANNAESYMNNALLSDKNAQTYMNKTKTYMDSATASADRASSSAASASNSEGIAKGYVATAQNSMNSAADSATSASESAVNAHNYYLQVESITNGLNGAFSPKGTVSFSELIELKESGVVAAGYLYHISDNFITDENFNKSGKECGAGTSVYYTVDDKFDFFVGTTVAGVKGKNEAEYRTGMVNITPENVGAIPSSDVVTVDEMKSYLGI